MVYLKAYWQIVLYTYTFRFPVTSCVGLILCSTHCSTAIVTASYMLRGILQLLQQELLHNAAAEYPQCTLTATPTAVATVVYGLFYNQGTSSKNYLAAMFNCRSLLWFQSAFAKTLIRVRSTYSNKEKVRINQLFNKICSFVMILPKIAVSFGFSQIVCRSITWNKRKESLFVNSEEIIWTRPFKI